MEPIFVASGNTKFYIGMKRGPGVHIQPIQNGHALANQLMFETIT